MNNDTKDVPRYIPSSSHGGMVRVEGIGDGTYVSDEDHEAEIASLRSDLEGYILASSAEAAEVDRRGEEIKRLRAEIEAYRKDAERYRWLRDHAPDEWGVWRWIDSDSQLLIDESLMDSEIDAAMKEQAQ